MDDYDFPEIKVEIFFSFTDVRWYGINSAGTQRILNGSMCFSIKWTLSCCICFLLSPVACLYLCLISHSSSVQMESPASTPAPPPLHLLGAIVNSGDISSPCEQIMVRTRSVAVNTTDAALATEPECLGPCEPGTSVNLEGIVWQETEDGEISEAL